MEKTASNSNRSLSKPTPKRKARGGLLASQNNLDSEENPITHSMVRRRYKKWAIVNGVYLPIEDSTNKLPPAQYGVYFSSSSGIYFKPIDINLDNLIELKDSASKRIIAQIRDFWTKEKAYKEAGFLWKRGILLFGPPGGGKTSTLQILSKEIVTAGGFSIYVNNPAIAADALPSLREIEPTRPIVLMLEDLDAMVRSYGETEILSLLDGEIQINNIVVIATTNYPERLDPRIVNRPSRFDYIQKIRMPNKLTREEYLLKTRPLFHNIEKFGRKELNTWVDLTKGMSLAHIKELIIAVDILKLDLDKTVKRLKTMNTVAPSSIDKDSKNAGFGFMGSISGEDPDEEYDDDPGY